MDEHGLPTNFGGQGMAMSAEYSTEDGEEEEEGFKSKGQRMPFHGTDRTMNMNPLILANVQNSPYFKVELLNLKAYTEVVDEIYYKVSHLEPWERGTRKTAGMSQTGMCGGVRGVSAGGVVSSAFCLLFKLHTLRMTKKQVYGLLNHCDSPYIRALGFMYLRFTLPPQDMWDWFEPYIEDEEEIDIKAGGGKTMTMGELNRLFLTRLEWFETRFPRIAVNYERQIRANLDERFKVQKAPPAASRQTPQKEETVVRDKDRTARSSSKTTVKSKSRSKSKTRDKPKRSRSRSRSKDKSKKKRSRSRSRSKEKSKKAKKSRSRSRESKKEKKRDRSRSKHSHKKHKRSRSRDKKKDKDRSRSRGRGGDYQDELRKFQDLKKKRSRSRSRSRQRR